VQKSVSTASLSLRVILGAALAFGLAPVAWATNGYFAHGHGAKSKGMAGASTALPQDALAAATNPASIVKLERRLDAGLDVFRPLRGGSIRGNFFGPDESFDGSRKKTFYIPDFGYVNAINDRWSWSFTAIGHGGMNTRYAADENPYARFGSSGVAGVDLAQLFLGPSLAYRITPTQSAGISVNYVFQRFAATGLSAFASRSFPGPYSESPDRVTDNGHDESDGVAVKLGWLGDFGPVSLGASYHPKIRMSKFDQYKGLFAEQGGFDIPESYSLGLAWRTTPDLTLTLDYQRINYSDVPSVGNPLSNFQNPDGLSNLIAQLPPGPLNDLLAQLNAGQTLLSVLQQVQASPLGAQIEALSGPLSEQLYGNKLGSDNGPGFGWRDVEVYKLGVSYAFSEVLTLRAGYSDLEQQPIPASETFFNILAPGVVDRHYTIGATYARDVHELTFHAMHAPRVDIRGSGSIPDAALPVPPASFGGGEADIFLEETLFGISYGYRFE
jgi:long-chain fatty acid transport protein